MQSSFLKWTCSRTSSRQTPQQCSTTLPHHTPKPIKANSTNIGGVVMDAQKKNKRRYGHRSIRIRKLLAKVWGRRLLLQPLYHFDSRLLKGRLKLSMPRLGIHYFRWLVNGIYPLWRGLVVVISVCPFLHTARSPGFSKLSFSYPIAY